MDYGSFIEAKTHTNKPNGLKLRSFPYSMFDFQKDLTDWALNNCRSAIFSSCGTGKSLMELTWAQNVVEHTNKPVLILTPLAVSAQTCREADKFGISSEQSRDGKYTKKIVVTNYEKLKYFSASDFSGVICDESSILKSFNGSLKNDITTFMKKVNYRLLATATAAPNDYTELGTSSEALGYLGLMDMLNKFFKNDLNNSSIKRMYGEAPKWRFKGHSEIPFWRWVTSWARALRTPSDLGYDDGNFILPELHENKNLINPTKFPNGMFMSVPAFNLEEQRHERKRTLQDRCEMVAERVNGLDDYSLVWCHLNDEGDLLEKLIPDSVQISGRDSVESKERKLEEFASGKIKKLISKPKIGAWGLNFQHCNHITYFPSHSFESYYQSVRRCWRFGQKREVNVDLYYTPGDVPVLHNMMRKEKQADKMFENLVNEMNNTVGINKVNKHVNEMEVPNWL